MKKRKVLICGATGFIGRNIAQRLAARKGLEVYGTYLSSKPFKDQRIKMIRVDLTKKNEVKHAILGKDIVIQAAATTSGAKDIVTRPYYHVTDNAVMNALIFRCAFDQKVSHLVFLSCTTMYQSSDFPVKETDFDANKELYPAYFGGGWTKVYNEKMAEFYSRISEAKYTVIRHSNVYGPYDKFDLEKSHVFAATITKVMLAPEGADILVWGRGQEERDLLHVSDLVSFVELALIGQKKNFEIYNVGCGSSISVSNLVKKIVHYSGKDLSIKYDLSKPTIKTKLFLDINKAKTSLGWLPKVSLDKGIKETIEWYKKNITVKD